MDHRKDQERNSNPSNLFLVRLWTQETPGDESEWRGRVQHVLTGEAHEFRDWMSLIYHMHDMMAEGAAPGSALSQQMRSIDDDGHRPLVMGT